MTVIRAEEIRSFRAHGAATAGLVTRSRGAREIMMWRRRIDAGSSSIPARADREHLTAVLSGSGVLRENATEQVFSAGDVLVVRATAEYELLVAADGQPFDSIVAMPLATRHYTPDGLEMQLPWTT